MSGPKSSEKPGVHDSCHFSSKLSSLQPVNKMKLFVLSFRIGT